MASGGPRLGRLRCRDMDSVLTGTRAFEILSGKRPLPLGTCLSRRSAVNTRNAATRTLIFLRLLSSCSQSDLETDAGQRITACAQSLV